jgi:hypothetical protein
VAHGTHSRGGRQAIGRLAVGLAALAALTVACDASGAPSGSPSPFVWPTPSPTVPLQTRRPSPTATSNVPTATPEPTATSTPAPSPYIGVQYVGGTLGGVWTLAAVRHGVHADSVRLVIEMVEPGDHVPLFRAVEVDNEANPFPGGHDPTWGAARIDLFISDLYAYGYPLGDELPIELDGNPCVTRIGSYPTYDDALLGFSIGLREPAAYEVHELTSPVRIVVDVWHGQ